VARSAGVVGLENHDFHGWKTSVKTDFRFPECHLASTPTY
jgi:hypothetical protein